MNPLSPILAQADFDGWQTLIYLLVFLLLPLLASLGKVLRKKSGMEPDESELEEVLGKEIVIVEQKQPEKRLEVPRARPLHSDKPTPAATTQPPPVPPVRARPVRRQPPRPVPPPTVAPARPAVPAARAEPPKRVVSTSIHLDSPHPETRGPKVDIHTEVERHKLEAVRRAAKPHVTVGPLTVDDLRRAIILKEVLGPPFALRKPGSELWDSF